MVKLFTLYSVIFLTFISSAFADMSIYGDARVRPRMDIDDKTGAGSTLSKNFYYMYRARLHVDANIGKGWFFKSILGHNGVGYYNGNFATGEYPDILGKEQNGSVTNETTLRSSVDFMELNFGRKTDKFGFAIGLLSAGSINDPLFDLHFYPSYMIDIAYFILNSDGFYGGNAYYKIGNGNLIATLMVDDNRGASIENLTGDMISDKRDQYTAMLRYDYEKNGYKFQPTVFYSIADDSLEMPITFGLNAFTPEFAGFKFGASIGYLIQPVKQDELSVDQKSGRPGTEYDAFFVRAKVIKPFWIGKLQAWFDYASRTDKHESGDITTDFMYLWFGYRIPFYSSDLGNFSVAPRLRWANINRDGVDLRDRMMIEMDIDIHFK